MVQYGHGHFGIQIVLIYSVIIILRNLIKIYIFDILERSWDKAVYEISPEETEYDGAGGEEVEESDFHPSDPEGEAKAKNGPLCLKYFHYA